ncbi:MAG: ABC transporter substrate-binding protein [Eudoraea sp.]|nr:ABC transporter substrate-binding protein [Eudoraea sp.]NNK30576.1 ABC transporter substrate-binding protein [Flavobacteriaceae bacterium]
MLLFAFMLCFSCKEKKTTPQENKKQGNTEIRYAQGFDIEKKAEGVTVVSVNSPWPGANKKFVYALVQRELLPGLTLNTDEYDAIISVPVERVIATSTTHIPSLEVLGVAKSLVGFPDTRYISSPLTRKRIDEGQLMDIGRNESLNTEMTIALNPDIIFGFSVNGENRTYETVKQAGIPAVYNGDWTENSPLGKAEWIKFYGPFFGKEEEAAREFAKIESAYLEARALAKSAEDRPTVLSGALYKDVWYLPAGESWAASFLEDAGANYLWKDSPGTGSLSLSIETVFTQGQEASFWVSPSQYTTYSELKEGSRHYEQFRAYRERKVYTFAGTKGPTGGLLYYEMAPGKPHEVLKDLIAIFHPELLPNRELLFFKPLK